MLDKSRPALANELHDCAALVRYAPPELSIRLTHPLRAEFTGELESGLQQATGMRWSVILSNEQGALTMREQELVDENAAKAAILDTPVMKAAKAAFPDAELLPVDENAKWSESA